MEKRQIDAALADIFVTVLFPEVPTGAPTGIAVPIEVTVTGTLNAADVPSGFQTPTELATLPANTVVPTETAAVTQTPTAATTETPSSTQQTSQTTASTQSTESTQSTQSTQSTPSTLSTTATSRASTTASRTTSNVSGTAGAASASATGVIIPHHDSLSAGATAGIVIGVVAFVAFLAILFLFLMRPSKRKKMRGHSPVYPEEAYLYDPPMSGANGTERALRDARPESIRAQSFGRELSRPATPNTETQGLLAGAAAGGAVAAGAAARERRGTMSGHNSPALRPVRGGTGYAVVNDRDITEMGAGTAFHDQDTGYRSSADAGPSAWPTNPNAPSGLGTPPASRGGPVANSQPMEALDPIDSRGATPNSMYRDNPGTAGTSSNAMRDVRRVWGMEQP